MKLISHRGNIQGSNTERENAPDFIREALAQGYEVEIDLWKTGEKLFLGHDGPQYEILPSFLEEPRLWVHCKNPEALEYARTQGFHFFWHDTDLFTLTSKSILWSHATAPWISNAIIVLPEKRKAPLPSHALGVCSDFIANYREL